MVRRQPIVALRDLRTVAEVHASVREQQAAAHARQVRAGSGGG